MRRCQHHTGAHAQNCTKNRLSVTLYHPFSTQWRFTENSHNGFVLHSAYSPSLYGIRSKLYLNVGAFEEYSDALHRSYRRVRGLPRSTIELSHNLNATLFLVMGEQVKVQKTPPMQKLRWYQSETDVAWIQLIIMLLLHIGGLYYLIHFPYREQKFLIIYSAILVYLMNIGITAGAHRLWSHRSYKAKVPLRILLAVCYYAAGHSSIYTWVRDHRVHHKYTDTEADPHNSNRGFWFCHIGWLIFQKNDRVKERRREIDMTDINQDSVVKFFDGHTNIMRILLSIVIPSLIPVYFFNQDLKWSFVSQVFLRYPYVLHAAFIVNSFGHTVGQRTYNKSIRPRENSIIAFITSGEGWHNYHHVFPWDYRAAECKSFLFNSTACIIDMFAKIGWAYDMKYATPDHIKSVVKKKGDGSHYTMRESTIYNE